MYQSVINHRLTETKHALTRVNIYKSTNHSVTVDRLASETFGKHNRRNYYLIQVYLKKSFDLYCLIFLMLLILITSIIFV